MKNSIFCKPFRLSITWYDESLFLCGLMVEFWRAKTSFLTRAGIQNVSLNIISYRFSAFWLRSKCSICSYQLNIWYEGHRPSSILNWFLAGDEVSVACYGFVACRPCIAVPQGFWHTSPIIFLSQSKYWEHSPMHCRACRCEKWWVMALKTPCSSLW